MVSGKCCQSWAQTADPSSIIAEKTTHGDGNDAGIMGNLFKAISPGSHKFAADGKPDQNRAKSAVGRRMQYVRDAYIDLEDNMACISLGVVLMVATMGGQGEVHFLYLALGGDFPRSHRDQRFLYGDGSLHLFSGEDPEYMISRRKEYAECFEFGMWRIGKRGDTSRPEADIFADMDSSYKAISAPDSGDRAEDVGGANVNTDGEWRGPKGKRNGRMLNRAMYMSPALVLTKKKVAGEIIRRSLDMWRTKESETPATSWGNADDLNCHEMIRKITDRVVKGI